MSEARLLRVVPVTGSVLSRPGPLRAGAVVPVAAQQKPKLLDQVRDAIRVRDYSYRTEACLPKPGVQAGGVRRIYPAHPEPVEGFIFFNHKRHPAEMGPAEITQFLTSLAVDRHVSASTQNQALAALLFLFKDVLGCDPGWMDDIVRAKRPERLPLVLTRQEVQALLDTLDGIPWIMAMVLYGSGLRLMEGLRSRVKDIDFSRRAVLVREGKGNKPVLSLSKGTA